MEREPPRRPPGWGPAFEAQLFEVEDPALRPGRVVAELGPRRRLALGDGETDATVAGRLRRDGGAPVVGDFVLARGEAQDAVVERVLERRTWLSRNAAGRATGEQLLAANVDVVFLVQGLDGDANVRRLERYLAAIWSGGAEPVILLGKCDLAADRELAREQARAAAPGVAVELVSARTGEGLDAVRARLPPGSTAVFAGSSGVGKSTLVNALLGDEVQVTREVRAGDHRGRHATTHRELFLLPWGAMVIDGPGIRELQLWDGAGLARAFDDLAEVAAGCRFADCAHEDEPGCAVRQAVEAGGLDRDRVESWRKLGREAAHQAARRDASAAAEEKRRCKSIQRELRRFQKSRGR